MNITQSPYTILLIGLVCGGVGYVVATQKSKGDMENDLVRAGMPPMAAVPSMPPAMPPVIVNVDRGDDRYTRAPEPVRRWDLGGGVLPSIYTRGPPDPYQQMGILKTEDGKVLPLYGRRTAPRSDRYQYYTRTDTYNPVALPVSHKKRDCQDGVGCEELFDGDKVKMAGTGESEVKLYGFA
jgi:hypothetical protein